MLEMMGKNAKKAQTALAGLTSLQKNEALEEVALGLILDIPSILAANEKDMQKGKENGMSGGLLDRLLLNENRITGRMS